MSRISRATRLLQNAEAALMSAIEVYNKPTFLYREETFAILAINAWELLLKAKVLAENHHDSRSLRVYYQKNTSSGGRSIKRYVKRNRSGNELTISLYECITALDGKGFKLADPIRLNLDALMEIRDNAIHYLNASPQLSKQVLEIGTAAVRNFVELGRKWFNLDLSRYGLYLMPIGFVPATSSSALVLSNDERKVIGYLSSLVTVGHSSGGSEFYVSLDVDISLKKSSAVTATAVTISSSPHAVAVALSEEDFLKIYKWDYATLTTKLTQRYIDFKANSGYHERRKNIASDPKFARLRYLDPAKKGSLKKEYYNPDILSEFDKIYTRR